MHGLLADGGRFCSCSGRIRAFQSQEIRISVSSFVMSEMFFLKYFEKRSEMPDVVVL